jgi:hypothetical protein
MLGAKNPLEAKKKLQELSCESISIKSAKNALKKK